MKIGGKHFPIRIISTSATAALLLTSMPLNAEFELNFAPKSSSGSGSGGWGGGGGGWGGSFGGSSSFSNVECGSSSTGGGNTGYGGENSGGGGFGGGFSMGRGCGTGYFLQEVSDGYFHVIVGDPVDDFAIEWYIRSSGTYDTDLTTGYLDNIDDPLSSNVSNTGNGAGNPRNVHIRSLVRGDGLEQEFLKATNANKPKITQDIINTDMTSHFVADMTNSTYSDSSTVGTIINQQSVLDSNLPEGSAHFDMADFPSANVTAGLYSHNTGSGTGEFKTYSYAKDGFEVYDVKWIDYCDPAQNPDHHCNIGGSNGAGGWGGSSDGGSDGTGGWGGGGW